jgi:2-polyprenyl-3-methyl-5-hydroxy-6-metoxy-1,4-benzoquinol methylase
MARGQNIPSSEVLPPYANGGLAERTLAPGEEPSLKRTEREWHDAFYKAHAFEAYPQTPEEFRESFGRFELTPFCDGGWSWWGDLRREILDRVGDVRGLRILDYGCGFGKLGMYLALSGAQVWGFDLAGEATKTANETASRYGLSAQFEQMDAEGLRYPEDFFDLAVGFGVLHHVIKYPGAAAQLLRVLKPGARAVFHETLWDNPFINLARQFTAEETQAGDASLTEQDIHEFCKEFGHVQLEKHHLFYMLKRLAKLPAPDVAAALKPRPFWTGIKSLDRKILRFLPLRRYCGEVIILLRK